MATIDGELAPDHSPDAPPDPRPGDGQEPEVPAGLQFVSDSAAHAARAADPGTVFTVDADTYRAFRPKETILAIVLTAAAPSATLPERVHAIMQFIDSCLDDGSQIRLKARLHDRLDPLDFDNLADVVVGLIRHWDLEPQAATVEGARARERALAHAQRPAGPGRGAPVRRGAR